MKKLLTLILIFFGYQAYAQVSVLNADSVRMGNPAGSGSVSISGKTYLKNITEGNSNDSVLVRGVAGIVKFVKRSAFADAGIPFFSGDGGAMTNGKLIYNATLQKLRIYDAASSSWKDASPVDLSGYYTKVQSDTRYLNTASNGVIKTGNNFSLGGDVAWDYSGSVRIGGSLQGQLYLDPNAWLLQLADVNNNSANILAQKLGSGGNMNIDLRAYNGPLGLSRAIVIDNTNATQGLGVVDDIGHSGFLYGGKYRANLSNRSIVDKEYVDSVANISGSTIHASNGLTKVGDTIKLGGDAVWNYTNQLRLQGYVAPNYLNGALTLAESKVYGTANWGIAPLNYQGEIGMGSYAGFVGQYFRNLLSIYQTSTGKSSNYEVNTYEGLMVRDSIFNRGMRYANKYRTGLTNRSIMDKEYIDSVAASGGGTSHTFNNGLVNSSGTVGLGGDAAWVYNNGINITASNKGRFTLSGSQAFLNFQNSNGNIAGFSALPLRTEFSYAVSGVGTSQIRISNSDMVVTDGINAKGLEDAANYDGNKTANSYVTKRMLDSVAAISGGSGAYIQANPTNPQYATIYLGGSTDAYYKSLLSAGNLKVSAGDSYSQLAPFSLNHSDGTTMYSNLFPLHSGRLATLDDVGGVADTTAYRTVANSFTKAQTNTQIANALSAYVPVSEIDNNLTASTTRAPSKTAVNTGLALKQDLLVSATNIKTVNGNSILGNGNLVVSGNQTLDQVLTAGNTSTQTANVGTITASAKILGKTTSGTGDLQIGADASNGNFRVIQNGGSSMFGTYDSVNSKYYGFRNDLSSPIANFIGFGGWYQGVASVAGVTSSATDPIFGVVTTNQTGNTPGKGGTNFHVSADKHVETFNNILDNGSGVMQVASLTASQAVFTDGSKNLVSVAVTGTGNAVRAASPTLTGTPLAPTAAAGTNTTQIATTEFVQAAVTKVAINTQTANYTLTLADAGKFVQQNVSSANSVTVPPNSTVAFPIGTQILLRQMGTGQVTITAGSGVTLQSADNALKSRVQFAPITLIKVATNTWAVMGDLTL